MLYVSTRSKFDSYTAYRALHEQCAPEGGMFVPMRLPLLSAAQIRAMKNLSFGQIAAQLLNAFFSVKLDSWDIDFKLGRNPIRLQHFNRQLIVAELWHNMQSQYSGLERTLYSMLCEADADKAVTQWGRLAIRICVLFAIYSQLEDDEIKCLDIAVAAGDFSSPMAACYVRSMGLPVKSVICGCNENGAVWDLVCRGELNTASADAVGYPVCVEQLIHATLGQPEAQRYADCIQRKATYILNEAQLDVLNKGLFAAVVGQQRLPNVISSFRRTNDYTIAADTALAYGALQDYRASCGASNYTLLLSETDPGLQL